MNEKEFCEWLAKRLLDEDDDEATAELACRRLVNMGYMAQTEKFFCSKECLSCAHLGDEDPCRDCMAREEEKMTKSELLESIVRTIGVLDYGKERWFPENCGWYDRYDGRVIDNTEMDRRVHKVLNELEEERG